MIILSSKKIENIDLNMNFYLPIAPSSQDFIEKATIFKLTQNNNMFTMEFAVC